MEIKMTYSTATWKYALLGTSCIISLLCVLLVSCGVVALGASENYVGAYIMTGLGSTVFMVCFIGCCAALRESYRLSIASMVLNAVMVLCEIVTMIAYAVLKDSLTEDVRRRVKSLWELESDQAGAMDPIQLQYKCCGLESPQDFLQDVDDSLPTTCCQQGDCSNVASIHSKGCDSTLQAFFDDQSDNLIWCLLALVAVGVIATVSSFYLSKRLENRSQKSQQIIIEEQ